MFDNSHRRRGEHNGEVKGSGIINHHKSDLIQKATDEKIASTTEIIRLHKKVVVHLKVLRQS